MLCSQRTIRRWMENGTIEFLRIGGRVYFTRQMLEDQVAVVPIKIRKTHHTKALRPQMLAAGASFPIVITEDAQIPRALGDIVEPLTENQERQLQREYLERSIGRCTTIYQKQVEEGKLLTLEMLWAAEDAENEAKKEKVRDALPEDQQEYGEPIGR